MNRYRVIGFSDTDENFNFVFDSLPLAKRKFSELVGLKIAETEKALRENLSTEENELIEIEYNLSTDYFSGVDVSSFSSNTFVEISIECYDD